MAFQSLGLTQSQQQRQTMTMSPLQRQSLDILQLPLMALEQRIREEAETNPAIDEVVAPKFELDAPAIDPDAVDAEKEASENDDDFQLHQPSITGGGGEDAEERRRYMFESIRQPVSLEQHLRSQIRTSGLDASGVAIAETIIANLSSTGMLAVTTGEIAEVSEAPLARVEEVLALIQETFDPPGIAARDVTERLSLQLKATDDPNVPLAMRIVSECLGDLAAGGREQRIAASLGVERAAVDAAVRLIKSLTPNPIAEFDAIEPTDYIVPEINVVRGRDGRWVATYDDETATSITINEGLRDYLDDDGVSAEDKSYIRERLRSAEALAHSLEQRTETILRVGAAIVETQQDFFTYGVSRLRPMTLADIAAKVGRHETTVGRAVEGKYLRSPRGIFELKYFFSTGLKATGDGQAVVSNKAVMDRIAAIVRGENPSKPFSDQDILTILQREGVEIKRRTVAKYRETLHIPPSSRRRR